MHLIFVSNFWWRSFECQSKGGDLGQFFFFFVIRITHIAHIKTNHKAQCGLILRSDSPSETGIRWVAGILSVVH